MASTDLIITINGQEFILSGSELTRSSTDERGEVLRRLDGIEQGQAVILQRLDTIESDLTILKHDQANLSTFMYWILGAIGIFIAAVSLPSISASLRKPESTAPKDDDKVKLSMTQYTELMLRATQND